MHSILLELLLEAGAEDHRAERKRLLGDGGPSGGVLHRLLHLTVELQTAATWSSVGLEPLCTCSAHRLVERARTNTDQDAEESTDHTQGFHTSCYRKISRYSTKGRNVFELTIM